LHVFHRATSLEYPAAFEEPGYCTGYSDYGKEEKSGVQLPAHAKLSDRLSGPPNRVFHEH